MTMSTARKPIGDCGPEFGRRFERDLAAAVRRDGREVPRRFAARMIEIGRTADRFERADLIQAECDRLLTLSDEEVAMTPISTTGSSITDIARQYPSHGRRAVRRAIAEGTTRPAPSALFTVLRDALEVAALFAFVAMVVLLADALVGRG
ncbi:hypothetical protein [Pinisolibacter sp.]|uniref:hypothetical protein n=1 Tax=Pinisolibacter sp. TaxID=2172024 RepID=UPI002FDCB6E4